MFEVLRSFAPQNAHQSALAGQATTTHNLAMKMILSASQPKMSLELAEYYTKTAERG